MIIDDITFLKEFVAIPSPSYHEAAVAAFLVEHMHQHGIDAHIDGAGNAVGMVGDGEKTIVMLGHIDTVPGIIPVHIEDGILYGRGSVDAKGSFATFVQATIHALQQKTLTCRVILIGAVEEEVASSKGAHYVLDTYTPDYCIIGEPSAWDRITLGYKGRLLIHYQRVQPCSHSAGEEPAAPEHCVALWHAVVQRCATHNAQYTRLFEQIHPSLRSINTTSDGLYDTVTATIGLRLPETIAPAVIVEELAQWHDAYTTITFDGACPAYRTTRTTPLANAFTRAIRQHGGTPGFVHKTGTSDMNIAGPAWQCPIVAYGPGDSRLDHTPHEHLAIAEYQQAIRVVTTMLTTIQKNTK